MGFEPGDRKENRLVTNALVCSAMELSEEKLP